ncbi:MAG: sigma-70 family RNA polymerase sigma factor [Verrucomicrobiota bacterium]|jgi:RNA polymerase sigma factor (sigma-70 family)
MDDATDMDLVRQYAEQNSDMAFAALVSRHVNLVYSAALRKTANPAAAEEITQGVFVILAQKAGRIPDKTNLPGWLYQTARLTAASFLKSEARRARREQEAYMQTKLDAGTPDETWTQLAPLLEDAMGQLDEKERGAVVLRFFGDKSFAEMSEVCGISENAAQKRVRRALEKLHRYFSKRGVSSTTTLIGALISANAVQAAPATLAKSVAAAAAAKAAAAGGSTSTLVKGALKIMAWTKAKTAVVAGVAAILAVGTTPIVIHQFRPTAAPEHFTRTFFKAFTTRNWDQVAKFFPSTFPSENLERVKELAGGLEVIRIGQPFQSNIYPGWLVPYEIKLAPMEINMRVSNTNSAGRYVVNGIYDGKLQPMEKLDWAKEPEALAANDVYARMTPAQVVKAYFDASKNGDWAAMGKLAPESDVEQTKQQFADAGKNGGDPRKLLPAVDVGEAVWSPEESSWFVKCRITGQVQKNDLRVRLDRHKGWIYEGGF